MGWVEQPTPATVLVLALGLLREKSRPLVGQSPVAATSRCCHRVDDWDNLRGCGSLLGIASRRDRISFMSTGKRFTRRPEAIQ